MEQLINYILQFGSLNQQQIALVTSKVMEMELRRDAYFSEAGKIPRQIAFVIEGVLRVCYYNNKGEEITRYFFQESDIVVDLKNYDAHAASSEYIQAVTDCKLLVFSREDWNELLDTIVDWEPIVNKIFKKAIMRKFERRGTLVEEDAAARYQLFMEKFPGLVNRIPLGYLASYLGINQSTLSRIRKKTAG
jgi:CRP-like cAMP-binding protein